MAISAFVVAVSLAAFGTAAPAVQVTETVDHQVQVWQPNSVAVTTDFDQTRPVHTGTFFRKGTTDDSV